MHTVQRDMRPKRGKVGGLSAKTPMQPRAKRTRGVDPQAAAHDATDETLTAATAATLTKIKESSHLPSEDVDQSLIVDYNESTSSPRSEGECGSEDTLTSSSSLSTRLETASLTNDVSLSVPSSTATNDYSTALEGASASSIPTIFHNGSDYEESEPKAPLADDFVKARLWLNSDNLMECT